MNGQLVVVAAWCSTGNCPTVYRHPGEDEVVVQGYTVDPGGAGVRLPAGETLVRIPRELLLEAARKMQ